jgi:hypothetical protein
MARNSLAHLFTSQDSQGPAATGPSYRTYNSPQQYFNPIYDTVLQGRLPDALPNPGAAPSRNQAPQLSLGGVNTAMGSLQGNWDPLLNSWRGVKPQVNQTAPFSNMLQSQISSAGAGLMTHGVGAFLGGGYQPWARELGNDGEYRPAADSGQQWQQLRDLSAGLGFDARPYGNNNAALYDAMNNYTRDYYGVGGLEGWSGRPGAGRDSAARTLYRDDGTGMLNPVTAPRYYRNVNDDKPFIGRESLTALSMALPMFGGWAGMLGSGTAGTLSAGSGLGLTTGLGSAIGTGATNALVNAGMGAMMNGSGGQGFLGNVLGSLGGAAMGSITGGANNLGNLFNGANAGMSALNPMGYFNDTLRNTGLSNSPLGQGVRGMGGIGRLANLFRS